jgi:hypothetical protein
MNKSGKHKVGLGKNTSGKIQSAFIDFAYILGHPNLVKKNFKIVIWIQWVHLKFACMRMLL